MVISNDSIQKLLPLLRPHLRNESERQAYLMLALGFKAETLNLIWNEPVNTFIPNIVQQLIAFGELTPGKPALLELAHWKTTQSTYSPRSSDVRRL